MYSFLSCYEQLLVQSLSHVQHFAIPWTVARQTPLSMGFSRQEHWSGLPCPPPGDLPNAGIEPMSLVSPARAGGFFTNSVTWEAHCMSYNRTLFSDKKPEKDVEGS